MCAGTIAYLTAQMLKPDIIDLLWDWKVVLAILIGGSLLGAVSWYLTGVIMRWVAGLFGGQASATELRAVFAWGLLPNIVATIVAVLAVVIAEELGGVDVAQSPAFLAVLVICLLLVSLYALVLICLMYGRVERFGFWRTVVSYLVVAYGGSLLLVLFLAIVIRTFLFQPFSIPSGSNVPTLVVGDYMFVTKYAYGYSRYSFPFAPPLFEGRIFSSEPQRGDVVVFRLPKDNMTDYVKRLVGLPGDRIQVSKGVLIINDQPVPRERLADTTTDSCGARGETVKQWRETLPNGVSYVVLDCVDNGFYDNTPVYTVPADSFFMMGDNRDNSTDSRVLSSFGYISRDDLIGRVGMIFFSVAPRTFDTKAFLRFDRIGMMVR
jgi:signal peptidase I